MENTFDHSKFLKFIQVVHVILKIISVVVYVFIGVLVVGFAVVLFLPRGLFDVDLANIGDLSHRYIVILKEINPELFVGVVNIKRPLLLALLTGITRLGFTEFVVTYLKKLIGNVKDQKIFDQVNASILKTLGYGFLIAAFVLPFFGTMTVLSAANTITIFQNIDYQFGLDWTRIYVGVLILILAYVFRYGTYLQEEHDATL